MTGDMAAGTTMETTAGTMIAEGIIMIAEGTMVMEETTIMAGAMIAEEDNNTYT